MCLPKRPCFLWVSVLVGFHVSEAKYWTYIRAWVVFSEQSIVMFSKGFGEKIKKMFRHLKYLGKDLAVWIWMSVDLGAWFKLVLENWKFYVTSHHVLMCCEVLIILQLENTIWLQLNVVLFYYLVILSWSYNFFYFPRFEYLLYSLDWH